MANRENNWTYCGDGNNLPEKEGFYMISLHPCIHHDNEELAVTKCFYSERFQSFMDYGRFVIAWQPLPPMYVLKDTDIVQKVEQ